MKSATKFLFTLLALINFNVEASQHQNSLVFGLVTNTNIGHSPFNHKVITKLRRAYRNLGIDLSFKEYPAKRSLFLSNNGTLDGELLRVKGITKKYPNLVPVTLYRLSVAAYTIEGETDVADIETILADTIAIYRGSQWQEKFIGSKSTGIVRVQTPAQQFKLLIMGRVKYLLCNRNLATHMIKHFYPQSEIKQVSPLIAEVELVHYLHQRHQNLIPQLTEQLSQAPVNTAMPNVP